MGLARAVPQSRPDPTARRWLDGSPRLRPTPCAATRAPPRAVPHLRVRPPRDAGAVPGVRYYLLNCKGGVTPGARAVHPPPGPTLSLAVAGGPRRPPCRRV